MSEYKPTLQLFFFNKMTKVQFSPLNSYDGWAEMNMKFIKLTTLNSIPASIQNNWKLCEITGAQVFAVSYYCDLEWRAKS